MATTLDKESVREAYNTIRDDSSEANWAVFKYEGNRIVMSAIGVDYAEFLSLFREDERSFGFVRVYTGDELSRRAKFAFITWLGHSVSALKRAKVSIDKSLVKEVISNFAVEILTSELVDLEEDVVRDLVVKAGGANYGTGSR